MKAKRSLQEIKNPIGTLPELAAQYNLLQQRIIDAMGEITPEIEAELNVTELALKTKVDNYVFIQDRLEADTVFFKRKADAYKTIATRFDDLREKLRDRVRFTMEQLGLTEVKGHDHKYVLSKGQPRLEIDPSKIPDEFMVIIQTKAPDKERIKAALLAGFEIPGAQLAGGTRLTDRENTGE